MSQNNHLTAIDRRWRLQVHVALTLMKSAKCFKTPILTYNHYMQEDYLEYI